MGIMEQNKIYPAMSGHNTICVATALLESGMVPMIPDDCAINDGLEPFQTSFILEAPAGLIRIKAICHNGKALRITLTNTVSFMDPRHEQIPVRLPMSISDILGRPKSEKDDEIVVDIAYGGMWYVIVDIKQLKSYNFELKPSHGKSIVKLGE